MRRYERQDEAAKLRVARRQLRDVEAALLALRTLSVFSRPAEVVGGRVEVLGVIARDLDTLAGVLERSELERKTRSERGRRATATRASAASCGNFELDFLMGEASEADNRLDAAVLLGVGGGWRGGHTAQRRQMARSDAEVGLLKLRLELEQQLDDIDDIDVATEPPARAPWLDHYDRAGTMDDLLLDLTSDVRDETGNRAQTVPGTFQDRVAVVHSLEQILLRGERRADELAL